MKSPPASTSVAAKKANKNFFVVNICRFLSVSSSLVWTTFFMASCLPHHAGQAPDYSVLSAEERNVAEAGRNVAVEVADGWLGRADWPRADRNCLRWG